MGKLVFSKLDSKYAQKVHDLVREDEVALVDAEREVLGMDHAEAGTRLCEKWDMPRIITEAVHYHHSPQSAEFISTLYVYLANELFYLKGRRGNVDDFCIQPINDEVIQVAGLTISQLRSGLLNDIDPKSIKD